MENDFKKSILLSVVIHLSAFLLLYINSKRMVYVTLPIELFFYGQPSAPYTAPSIGESQEIISKKKEEIAVSRKKDEKKKKEKEGKKEKAKDKVKETRKETPAETMPGGTGGTSTDSLLPSSQISFDAAKFPYAYYTNTIVKKIGRYWQWSTEFGQLKTVLYFKIQRDGNISEVEVKTSSGDDSFDRQAERAVRLSSPFPPLPDGYQGGDLGVYFEFSFR